MSRFLETICILDGVPRHLIGHQQRVDATLRHFYPGVTEELDPIDLKDILAACPVPAEGKIKCRILYDLHTLSVEFESYVPRVIKQLKVVEWPSGAEYRFKYADRSVIDHLSSGKGEADDILIIRDSWVTDTSYANIAFRKGARWYTPVMPLLAGTTWKRLIRDGVLIPRPIHQEDLHRYEAFRIFNAMNDWGEVEEMPVGDEVFYAYPLISFKNSL